jgi:uncharacterized protein (DUF2237 family)
MLADRLRPLQWLKCQWSTEYCQGSETYIPTAWAQTVSVGHYDFAVHTVCVLALPDTIAFDLSTPIEVFGRVRLPGGRPGYRVQICAAQRSVTAGPLRLPSTTASTH